MIVIFVVVVVVVVFDVRINDAFTLLRKTFALQRSV